MMFLADKVTAEQALQYGMVYKVSSAESLITDALEITTRLSNMPTKGFGLTKRALNESLFNNLDDQLEIEEELQSKAASTYDNQEGINAFLEKRKPVFKGE
jgi:2-(1,2-epoxy-1,2-dihydrophenyl)acetyl-CoA isomerase